MTATRSDTLGAAVFLCVGWTLAAGCAAPTEKANAPPEKSTPATEIDLSIPVVYDPRLKPLPLTDEQKKEILRQAALVTPKEQRLWYLHVAHNYLWGEELWPNVTVYFTPDVTTPRLRKGKCLRINTLVWWKMFMINRTGRKELWINPKTFDSQELQKHVRDYWQVSFRDRPFTAELHPPTKPLWPFAVSAGLTDEEVVEIADFVRPFSEPGLTPGAPQRYHPIDATQPILSISRLEDGSIEVWTGSVQGPTAGRGHYLKLHRAGKSFVVVKTWLWVS